MSSFNYSEWLEKKLEERCMTLRELADQVGVTEVTMSRYHTGKRIPSVQTAMEIAAALGIDALRVDDFNMKADKEQPEEELEVQNCPFCGEAGVVRQRVRTSEEVKNGIPELFWVECSDSEGCGAETGGFHTKEEAINAWNRRN